MAKGYTTITLKGGSKDGGIIEDLPLNRLQDTLCIRSETYFASTSDGSIVVMKGDLNNFWHSYSVDIYCKKSNEKYLNGTIFKFVGSEMVERCTAITKMGARCLKPAKNSANHCGTHNQDFK